jgi:TonB-dependent SusC/RagA subfamily outer membrane receptor
VRARAGRALASVIIALVLNVSVASAQQGTVAGVVVAEATQQPLAGVQILVEGTSRGALTDASGRFRIDGLTGSEVTLRVIILGYRSVTRTVPVGSLDMRFGLAQSAIELDQLVVTGTPGAAMKRSLGNALAQISASQIVETTPVSDVSQLLNARAAGVILQTQQGTAGGGARILIRGRGSMQFAGTPLIYIDGVRVNNDLNTGPSTPEAGAPVVLSRLDDVNPNDIESIEIIKGPAAATLYGTEASAGVIQIITKRGRPGNARVSLQVRQGVNWLRDQEGVVGTVLGRDASTGQVFEYDPLQVLRARGAEYFRTGHTQGYDVSVSGGSDGMQFYVSGGWDREEGIVPSNVARNLRARANVSFQPRPTVNMRADAGLTTGRTDTYHFLYFFSGRYAIPAARNTPSAGFNGGLPPDVQNETQEIYQDVSRFTGSVQVNHRPTTWLDQRLTLGLDLTDEQNGCSFPSWRSATRTSIRRRHDSVRNPSARRAPVIPRSTIAVR